MRRAFTIGLLIGISAVSIGGRSMPSQSMAVSPVSSPTFKIADSSLRMPLSLVAYGDMRFTNPKKTKPTNPQVRMELVQQIAKINPDVLLVTGDIPFKGGDLNDYAVYKQETQAWRNERLRVYPALGNHEFKGCELSQCLKNWWSAFPLLHGRRWYSVQIGNSVDAIVLDSNDSLEPQSPQIAWLKSQLDSLPGGIEFVLITMHHPPVADPAKGVPMPNSIALRNFLNEVAPSLKAKILVIASHVHNYERFYENGIMYVVTGGGGAKQDEVTRTPEDLYKGPSYPNYHYLRFVLQNNTLNATMYRLSGDGSFQPEDRFDLTYEGP